MDIPESLQTVIASIDLLPMPIFGHMIHVKLLDEQVYLIAVPGMNTLEGNEEKIIRRHLSRYIDLPETI